MQTPMMVMMRLPTIGFSRPPALPGGGVISREDGGAEAAEALPEQRAEDEREHGEAHGRWRRATAPSRRWLTLARLL